MKRLFYKAAVATALGATLYGTTRFTEHIGFLGKDVPHVAERYSVDIETAAEIENALSRTYAFGVAVGYFLFAPSLVSRRKEDKSHDPDPAVS